MLNKEVRSAKVKKSRLTPSDTMLKCYISHRVMLRKPCVSPPPAEEICMPRNLEKTCTLAIYSLRM